MTENRNVIPKKSNTVIRSFAVLFLTLAMVVTLIPAVSETVYAAEVSGPPSSSAFIDGSSLNGADMDYGLTTGKTAQAVYFGTNGESAQNEKQKWWIAGFDESGLVLMCDPQQPLKTGKKFDNTTVSKDYRAGYGSYETAPAEQLFPNHYGASEIRSVLRDLAADRSCFTQAEQDMMKETTVYTYDVHNKVPYTTTDKLYLAAGCFDEREVFVGQNAIDSSKSGNEQIRNGLRIGLNNISSNGSPFADYGSFPFWTRSAEDYKDSNTYVLHAIPSNKLFDGLVTNTSAVVPALALDTDNVLFASAAPAGESFADIVENETMTFRCDGRDRIRSTATFTGDSVPVDYDDSDSDLYLYVQGSDSSGDWFFSQKIEGESEYPASYIHRGANLTNCKVWLETVEDNIVYAKPASYTGTYPNPLYGIVTPPDAKKYTYTGKQISGIHAGTGYSVSGSSTGTSVGEYSVTAALEDGYVWSDGTTDGRTIVWQILKAGNPMKLKPKTATVKRSKVRKKAQKLARSKVLTFTKAAEGKVTYKKLSGSGKLSIDKTTGKVTVKKKTRKGTYKMKVKVTAAGNSNYHKITKIVTVKVKIK